MNLVTLVNFFSLRNKILFSTMLAYASLCSSRRFPPYCISSAGWLCTHDAQYPVMPKRCETARKSFSRAI